MKSALISLTLVHAAVASPCTPSPCKGENTQCWVEDTNTPVCACDEESMNVGGPDSLECVRCSEFSCGTKVTKLCSANTAHGGLNYLTCACDDGHFAIIPGYGEVTTWGAANDQFAQNLECFKRGCINSSFVEYNPEATHEDFDMCKTLISAEPVDSATRVDSGAGSSQRSYEAIKLATALFLVSIFVF